MKNESEFRIRCLRWVVLFALPGGAMTGDAAAADAIVSPYLDIKGAYESNVYRISTDEIDDFYVEPEVGVDFRSSTDARWLLNARLFYSRREYLEEDRRDFDGYGGEARLTYEDGGRTGLELLQSYRRLGDVDLRVPDPAVTGLPVEEVDIQAVSARRDVYEGGAAWNRQLTDKSDNQMTYRYSSIDYRDRELRDRDSHRVGNEIGHGLTDKSAIFFDLSYEAQNQRRTKASGDWIRGLVGLRTRATDKLTGRAGAGINHYERDRVDGARSTEQGGAVDASVAWTATEKVTIGGGVDNGLQISSLPADNAREYTRGWGRLTYQLSPHVVGTLRVSYQRDRYLDKVVDGDTTTRRRDGRLLGAARIHYRAPSDLWGAYAQVVHESVSSTLARREYDNTRAILGAEMRY